MRNGLNKCVGVGLLAAGLTACGSREAPRPESGEDGGTSSVGVVELTPVLAKEEADDDYVASDVWPGRLAPAPLA